MATTSILNDPACDAGVERAAFYFESHGSPLFAWLHRSADRTFHHGIVICPPLGHEQVHSHRALRHLADKLAAQGFTVLRLDYHGTGDSDGTPSDPARVSVWQANVRDAAEWLRTQADCHKISLVGLRFGATLTALHAEAHPVENVVLWAPIVKGRRYVRELTALSRTAAQASEASSNFIEAVGFVYTNSTTQELSQIDLTTRNPRFQHGLILQSENGPKDPQLFDHLSKLALPVEQHTAPGYEEMMAEPQFTEVPHAAIAHIAHWLLSRETMSETSSKHALPGLQTSMRTSDLQIVRESIHRICDRPDLFGISSELEQHSASLPWILMLNSGAAYRIGPGRLHVKLARRLAALGYPCMRIDITGLGDSRVDEDRDENDTYAATAIRDAAIACDYLQRLQPGRPIILMGLCSGAYAAFQSAVQLPHPALIESILLNPLTYFWKDGMSLTASPTQRLQVWYYYWGIIFDKANWRQLLSGGNGMGIKGALQRFYQRLFPANTAKASPSRAIKAIAATTHTDYGHPPKENLKADLKRITTASRKLALFVSENDPGHFLLMFHARRTATQMIRSRQLQYFSIPNADHTFSTESARQALKDRLTDYLHSRFGSS
jgi:alpha-beta hydrolase superfamily lysophospholipase